jgi:hypothetical protein
MARKRMLSPDMFTSETISSQPIPTRWTWAGLLTYLDDYGRGKDNAALVKAAVWPLDDAYTSKKVAADLDRLEQVGSLCRYTCCGSRQLHAPNWETFQKVSHKTDSKVCPCPEHDRNLHEEHRRDSGDAPDLPGKTLHSLVKSSSVEINEVEVDPAHLTRARSAS